MFTKECFARLEDRTCDRLNTRRMRIRVVFSGVVYILFEIGYLFGHFIYILNYHNDPKFSDR